MQALSGFPFSLQFNDTISVKAFATNAIGAGSSSVQTGPATVLSVPSKPENPPSISNSSTTGFTVNIFVVTNNGGMPITNYILEYMPQNGNWTSVDMGINLTITINTNIVPNVPHLFRYSAKNMVGSSAFSDISQSIATAIPSASVSIKLTNTINIVSQYSVTGGFNIISQELQYFFNNSWFNLNCKNMKQNINQISCSFKPLELKALNPQLEMLQPSVS